MSKARKIVLIVATAFVVGGGLVCLAAFAAVGFDPMGFSTSEDRFEIVVYDDRVFRSPDAPETPEPPTAPEPPAAPEPSAASVAPTAPPSFAMGAVPLDSPYAAAALARFKVEIILHQFLSNLLPFA